MLTKNGAEVILIYLMLLCTAAKSASNGALTLFGETPHNAQSLAALTGIAPKKMSSALETLMHFELLRFDNDTYFVAECVPKRRNPPEEPSP